MKKLISLSFGSSNEGEKKRTVKYSLNHRKYIYITYFKTFFNELLWEGMMIVNKLYFIFYLKSESIDFASIKHCFIILVMYIFSPYFLKYVEFITSLFFYGVKYYMFYPKCFAHTFGIAIS